ncbi:MAG: hypothetical protein PHV34_09435 [Verrucomicrobiae bacterium]|nr:hypothetical protein [Verrucomicrobiae bacterium]
MILSCAAHGAYPATPPDSWLTPSGTKTSLVPPFPSVGVANYGSWSIVNYRWYWSSTCSLNWPSTYPSPPYVIEQATIENLFNSYDLITIVNYAYNRSPASSNPFSMSYRVQIPNWGLDMNETWSAVGTAGDPRAYEYDVFRIYKDPYNSKNMWVSTYKHGIGYVYEYGPISNVQFWSGVTISGTYHVLSGGGGIGGSPIPSIYVAIYIFFYGHKLSAPPAIETPVPSGTLTVNKTTQRKGARVLLKWNME